MSYNRIGEDFFISGSVSAAAFYGDGTGLTGIIGTPGATGPAGPKGATGSAGSNGSSGTSGSSGVSGAAGANGSSGTSGTSFSGTGTLNYVAKWNSTNGLQNSNIQDSGYPNGVGINYAPQSGTILAIGNAVQPDTFYALNNYATSSTTRVAYFQNYGNPGTGPKLGVEIFVPTGASNYALKIQDGRQASGYVLTSDASGNAYWAANAGGGGGGATASLAQVMAIGATASANLNMASYSVTNIASIGASTGDNVEMINVLNMTLLNLMYNT